MIIMIYRQSTKQIWLRRMAFDQDDLVTGSTIEYGQGCSSAAQLLADQFQEMVTPVVKYCARNEPLSWLNQGINMNSYAASWNMRTTTMPVVTTSNYQ